MITALIYLLIFGLVLAVIYFLLGTFISGKPLQHRHYLCADTLALCAENIPPGHTMKLAWLTLIPLWLCCGCIAISDRMTVAETNMAAANKQFELLDGGIALDGAVGAWGDYRYHKGYLVALWDIKQNRPTYPRHQKK